MIAAILVLMQGRTGLRDFARMDRTGWLVASLSTVGMVCFIPALQLASVSNVTNALAIRRSWTDVETRGHRAR